MSNIELDSIINNQNTMKSLNEEVITEEKIEAEVVSVISEGKQKLKQWLNSNFRIEMTDGRILIGVFVCTDRDANVILGSCSEYLKAESDGEEPRVLGLVMVPGRHIVSIQLDDCLRTFNRNTGSSAE